MKKMFAALAASAVAVSMLAFAGCGPTETVDKGAIKGDYVEKTPEQVTEIVDKVDTDKIFDDKAESVNMGLRVNLNGSFDMAGMMSASGSLNLDYKMSVSDEDVKGAGSFSVNANMTSTSGTTKNEQSFNIGSSVYTDGDWSYASVTGIQAESTEAVKAKINMQKLVDAIMGGVEDEIVPSPAAFYAAEDAVSVSSLLAMAQEYGAKVSIDDKDGLKIKVSVTEETVWKLLTQFGGEGGVTPDQVAQIKETVTFNAFKFDLYFALDANGAFSGASVVMNIDLKMPVIGTGSPAAAAADEMPMTTIKIGGYVELYSHNETVTVPETVTGDASYVDMTDTIITLIGQYM